MPRSCRARPSTGRARTFAANSIVQSDAAPDGTAAIAYLKNVAAVPHVFVSRLVDGAWTRAGAGGTPRSDASSAPRIAVANGGKVVVTFANGGNLHAVVKPSASAPFGAPTNDRLPPGSYGEVDLAPGGNGYVAVKAHARATASRLEGTTFTPVVGALNNDPTKEAGAQRPRGQGRHPAQTASVP